MINSFQDRLGNARRAARRPAKGLVLQTESLIRSVSGILIGECLSGHSGRFSTREVFDASPHLSGVYVSANALGTALGEVVGGKGLGLHRDRSGRYHRSRTNAALTASRLTDTELTALATALNFDDVDSLIDAIDALPDASVTH